MSFLVHLLVKGKIMVKKIVTDNHCLYFPDRNGFNHLSLPSTSTALPPPPPSFVGLQTTELAESRMRMRIDFIYSNFASVSFGSPLSWTDVEKLNGRYHIVIWLQHIAWRFTFTRFFSISVDFMWFKSLTYDITCFLYPITRLRRTTVD